MEYNNYYSTQAHPTPPPPPPQQSQPIPPHPHLGNQMMHAPPMSHTIRTAMPPGPPPLNHHQPNMQPMPPQQHLGHPPPAMSSPHQLPTTYHQAPASQPIHAPPLSHSVSPHPQQIHNHHTNGPPHPNQVPTPGMPPHMHTPSPIPHNGPVGPAMHMQQQPSMNQMIRTPMGPSVMNHPQPPSLQPPPQAQNFTGSSPHFDPHHFHQTSQHNPHHQPPHQTHHHPHQPQPVHHAPQVPHHPHIPQPISRNSPCPNIYQTELRIIELNRWLQTRPIPRHPASPQPSMHHFDESRWWEKFAYEFFEDDATLTLRIQDDKPVEYSIGRTLIPRFFKTYFDGGVTDLSFNLRNPKELFIHPQLITLDCDQAFIVSIFRHTSGPTNPGVVVHTEGHLILDFVSSNFDTLSIKSWKFYTKGCREYIDRSITVMGPNMYLAEPMSRQVLTKSTISYLKMCMIMEPMQDLMFQHRQTKIDPRSCLRKYLYDRFKFSCNVDTRTVTKSRRKRKSAANTGVAGATNKRTKANMNNAIGGNGALNNNLMMSPSQPPNFSLASQDVMVVGEPSMMGGNFGDDNERMITRLENNQFESSASTPSHTENSDTATTVIDNNGTSNHNNVESNIDQNHNISPSLLQQRQQQQQHMQQPLQQHHVPPPPVSQGQVLS